MIDIKILEKQFKYLKIYGSDTSIYTPFKLVNEMLDKLPSEVWKNPSYKFLDPCCGRGTFLICIYDRLFEGLKSIIISDSERKYHILNNMIYGIDINSIAIDIAKVTLDSKNIICENSLEYDFNMKFDVIVGNPPYQSANAKSSKIYIKFIQLGLNLLKDVMCFVTPQSIWTGRNNTISSNRKKFISNVQYIDFNAGKYFPNVGEKICWCLMKKLKQKSDIEILYENEIIKRKIKKTENIVNSKRSEIVVSIVSKIESYPQKIKFVEDYSLNGGDNAKQLLDKKIISLNKTSEYNIEFIYSGAQKFWTNNFHTYGDKLKVFINFSSSYKNMWCGKGVIGKQVIGKLVGTKEQGKKIISTLTKKIFLFYINEEKSSGFNTGITKLPELDFSIDWSNQDLYNYFNLTQEEINVIESSIK